MSQLPDVFHDDDAGSSVANGSSELPPQPATRPTKPRPPSRAADVLTREAAAQDVDRGETHHRLHVAEVLRPRPPALQYVTRVRVDLAVPLNPATEDRLHCQVEAADAAE